MAYIPKHCHQQGRIKQTGVWLPRRADGTPEAAHAATPLSDDTDAYVEFTWPEMLRLVAPFVLGVAAVVVALAFYGWR
ncbi:MAG: hypothetical protein RL227_1365 [Pseudomonadota bacterium]|jgi:hypothetical protein